MSSSLADSLRTAHRARIPEGVMSICDARDRAVVENIITLVGEVAGLNIAHAALVREKQTYIVTMPLPTDAEISLADLRQVESYSPARVVDLRLAQRSNHPAVLRCVIADESAPVLVSETDVLRVTKRKRWWDFTQKS